MKRQIKHVGVAQCGKVMAGIYLIIAIPMVAFMLLVSGFSGQETTPIGIGGAIFMVVIYPLLGFLSGVIGAWLYNLVAARIGGFEYTTVDVS